MPWIPVPDLVERHLKNLRAEGVTGLMLSWTVGGYPGGNLDQGRAPAPATRGGIDGDGQDLGLASDRPAQDEALGLRRLARLAQDGEGARRLQ